MAYEYNSKDQRFEFPNPYKIENIFKFLGATLFILSGVLLLLNAKNALSGGPIIAAIPLVMGIMMLIYGGLLLTKGLSNLKFYFGRDQPASLAPEYSDQEIGISQNAQRIKDLLRQSALSYHEPRGPINGILYSLFPNLIFSPLFIRNAAEVQFQSAIVFIITLISALVTKMGASGNALDWLGIFYNILTLFVLVKPMGHTGSSSYNIEIFKVVALIVLAIIGPVVIPMLTHNAIAPAWLPSMGKAIFILVMALIAIGIFFLAVISQMVKSPPPANAGMVQDSMSMNCQPMQIFDELERNLQDQWVSSIPNRIYSRILPILENNKDRGTFEGEILEETQPVPANTLKDMTFASCFKEKYYRWLGVLNSFGLLCFFASVILLSMFTKGIYNGHYLDMSYFSLGFLGISLWILGRFCFTHGSYLWSRFDFVSKLIWVEVKGNYQASQMNFGRYLEDTVKTQKEVINVETMTIRVWVAEIATTAFGKFKDRSILSMVACKDDAVQLKDHLVYFAQEQSLIIAPTANSDLDKLSTLNQINASVHKSVDHSKISGLSSNKSHDSVLGGHQAKQDESEPHEMPIKSSFCTSCGFKLETNMAFCPQCGTKK